MSAVAPASADVRVLWMDDQPENIVNYRNMLVAERGGNYLKIDIATTIKDANEKLKTNDYAALIVDCKMEVYSTEENGAKFLSEINESQKDFPTFVYSGYVDDSKFRRYLKQSHPIKIVNKAKVSIERPVWKHWFFKEIHRAATDYLEVKDIRPEWIPFADFMANPQRYEYQTSKHWKKHGHWISARMKAEGHIWVVVCGDKIVSGSGDLFEFPDDDELIKYGQKFNLVPFPYSSPSLPEDIQMPAFAGCVWNPTSQQNDYYPAFVATIGDIELMDDFDTGAQHTFVSDEVVSAGPFDRWRDAEVPHLGQEFKHMTKKITLTVIDSAGERRSHQITVVVIKDWAKSKFVHFNDKRRILFGRDILRAFELEVSLNSQKRITRIRFL